MEDTPTVNEIINSVIPQKRDGSRSDAAVWADILKLQLDGVMMHIVLFEEFSAKSVCGYAAMHKHHAKEEFAKYLHVMGDYINTQKIIPEVNDISQPVVKIDGATKEEIMIKGMEAYENWEKKVCKYLKEYQSELTEGKEYVCHLIDSVHDELKCIHLMENDLIDGKYEKLDNWLFKKWGD